MSHSFTGAIAVTWLSCAWVALACPAGVGVVSYEIEPRPAGDRVELRINMRFTADESGETSLRIPACGYGTPDMHEHYTAFEAGDASIERGEDPWRLLLTSAPAAEVSLSYTLSWDPSAHTGYAYRPSVGPSHFHFFDRQWRIRPEGDADDDIVVDFTGVPAGWSAYTNIDAGEAPYTAEAREREEAPEILIAGGDYIVRRADADGTKVAVALRPVFENSEALADEILGILGEQQARFGAASDSDFVVSMTDRERIRAGVKIDSSFVCLVNPETNLTGLRLLIAHEAFHRWMPAKASITPDTDDDLDWYLFDWVHEGMTEYVARRMLLDSGRITRDEFVEAFCHLIINWRYSTEAFLSG